MVSQQLEGAALLAAGAGELENKQETNNGRGWPFAALFYF
jgi:hypothetical protein